MREIKFRAWDKKELGFCKPFTVNHNGTAHSIFGKYDTQDNILYWKKNVDIMQYTGIKDKNGKEIYENDIVIWKQADGGLLEHDKNPNEYICKIDWRREQWNCRANDQHCGFTFSTEHMEVIGNIYENPDLVN